jgi:hypothetical protein
MFMGRTSIGEYKELIRLAKEMNMNNIRIFGWHPVGVVSGHHRPHHDLPQCSPGSPWERLDGALQDG